MEKGRKTTGIMRQVALLFIISTVITGVMIFLSQRMMSRNEVLEQTETLASNVADDVIYSLKEYPAYKWLVNYWQDHPEEMDIEYDVDFQTGTKTAEKAGKLEEANPGIETRYITQEQAESLSPEDQKLFAEICYSWLITRINQIKRTYDVSYLFCVTTDDEFKDQFFLFSGADPGAKRGTNYEEVYTLGVHSTVSEDQQEAMRMAAESSSHLANAGNYMDCYFFVEKIQGKNILIGMTYDLTGLQEKAALKTRQETAFAVFHQLALSTICLFGLFAFVLQPLKEVQRNIRLYKDTKDSKKVKEKLDEVTSRNEIGTLARDVTELSLEMDDYIQNIETITAEKERIGAELSLATEIQTGMLPNIFPAFPDRKDFDIYASMDPAKEVGGDFYNYFLVDDDHLCLMIADVSGKGIPAALFMMASMIILGDNAIAGKTPAEILRDTNESICASNKGEMFVTVWLGILELSTGILTAANAGHEYPVIKQPGGQFQLLKDKHGFVVGGMEGMVYREYQVKLEKGSKLFVYTDGLPEATSGEQELFGTDRMIDALNQVKDESPKEILTGVRKSVDGFVKEAEQFDDLTMLCLEYMGPAQE